MKKVFKTICLGVGVLFFVAISPTSFSQISYKLDPENSSMQIKGTSTIHDWEMNVDAIKSDFVLLSGDLFTNGVVSGNLIVNVKAIKSEHSLMDKKTYEALKQNAFPKIEAKVIKAALDNKDGNVRVELTIAGETRTVTESVQLNDLGNGKVKLTGELPIKMSDYNIEPPVAMMGAIKTGDEVKVEFNLIYNKEGQLFGDANNK